MQRMHGLVIAGLLAACGTQPDLPPDVEWRSYANDPGGTKYSALDQIDRTNVQRLEVAWTARTGDFPESMFDPETHRAGGTDEGGAPVDPRAGAA